MGIYKDILESLLVEKPIPYNPNIHTKSGNAVLDKKGNKIGSYSKNKAGKAVVKPLEVKPDKEKPSPEKEPEKTKSSPEKEVEPQTVNPEEVSKSISKAKDKLARDAKDPKKNLSDEDVKTTNAVLGDFEKLNGMSGDEREKFAKEMITKYKLSTNEGQPPKKLYIRSISSYKALGDGNATTQNFYDMLNPHGLGNDAGTKGAKNALQTSSKPELETQSTAYKMVKAGVDKKTGKTRWKIKEPPELVDENVNSIFEADELFLAKLDPKYKGVNGPKGSDGKLLHPSSEHSKEYFEQSVNENKAITNTIEELKKQEKPPTNLNPKMRQSLEAHQKRLEELRDTFDDIKDPKERASKVAASYATLFQQMHSADSEVGGSMIKNMAEMSLYDTEIAGNKEAYLPSAGTFPSGDKLRVDRDGKGKVEKVASVSVKYGKKGQFYGFPGQTDQYQMFHPEANDPKSDYYDRQANRAGREGKVVGLRDDLIDDPKKFNKMIEDSGMGETIKDPKKLQDISKRMKDKMIQLKKDHGMPPEKETAQSLQLIQEESEEFNKELMKELDDVMDWDKIEGMLGKGDMRLCQNPKFGVLALTNIISFMGVVKTGDGLPGLEHNHQEIHDGKYISKTEKGSDNPKAWNFNFRPFGTRGGGLIAGYNGNEVPPPENAEIQLDEPEEDEPEDTKEEYQYESMASAVRRVARANL